MEKETLNTQISSLISESILDARPFGREKTLSFWVKIGSLLETAKAIKEDPVLNLNWLENFSVFKMGEMFVLTYFVRSSKTSHELVMRASYVPGKEGETMRIPSIAEVWPMGMHLEKDAEARFGIFFNHGIGH